MPTKHRARDIGIPLEGITGAYNNITDVPGVEVGYSTLIMGKPEDYATEEAILNAMVAAETMVGINGNTLHALPHDQVQDILRKFGRLEIQE
jgi:L-aminopeptidase/D-esterase-like protein